MEPPAVAVTPPLPPISAIAAPSHPPNPPYTDSVDSSPRSRTTEPCDGAGDPLPPVPGGGKLRLLCSYGGHIVPRPHDKSLCYVGGDTRIVVVDRNTTLPELFQRLSKTLLNGRPFILKYQLPCEDLDSLITVSSEEDLDNMVDEYDRLIAGSSPAKPSRIRLFLFPTRLDAAVSMGPIIDGSSKSDDWFLSALNGAGILQRGFSDPASVNCLLGLDENHSNSSKVDLNSKEGEAAAVGDGVNLGLGGGKGKSGNQSNQDVRSVPDSPIVDATSSFGSASSSPSLANLPPIRVHVEEGNGARVLDHKVGIEDQFAQMAVNAQKQEEGFLTHSSTPTEAPNSVVPGAVIGFPTVASGEFLNRVVSDDERSDHSMPKPPQPQPVTVPTSQVHQKQSSSDLPSPDSTSSDTSFSTALSRPKPVIYQDPSGQITSANFIDSNMVVIDTGARPQQLSESDYVLHQQQHEHFQQVQHMQQHQQQIQQPQTQSTQPQQFIHAGTHYVQHHQAGPVPISYYPVYPSQQPFHHHPVDQRYPVYYVHAGQAPPYNLPVQQQHSYSEAANVVPSSQPQTPPLNPTRTAPTLKADTVQTGIYRTGTAGAPQPVQVSSQQQFSGYTQMHYLPQSVSPNAAYHYEVADPAHQQLYYTQPLAPKLAGQYQTMVPAVENATAQLPTDAVKPQTRTSQAL